MSAVRPARRPALPGLPVPAMRGALRATHGALHLRILRLLCRRTPPEMPMPGLRGGGVGMLRSDVPTAGLLVPQRIYEVHSEVLAGSMESFGKQTAEPRRRKRQ